MRIIRTYSSNWSEMINNMEDKIVNNISKDITSVFSNIEGYIRHDKYKIYENHTTIEGLKVTFVFTISYKKYKSETFIYYLHANTKNDFCRIETLDKNKKQFKLNDYKNIKNLIIDDLILKSDILQNYFISQCIENTEII